MTSTIRCRSSMPMRGQRNGARMKKLVELGASPNDCWTWIGNVSKRTGYGKKQWYGKSILAHRWVWQMFFGKIPDGLVINHKCSNKICVNPQHLEVVTTAENCRHGKGTKLTPSIVRAIREIEPQRGDRLAIANLYGITPMTVSDLRNRRSWVDI